MRGIKHVSTSNEIKIASNLPNPRSKIFLESRAYIRESLSTLFNLNPLEIPLIANPGEPPILPKGMGNISISHCKDALIVTWHKDKIGIDIERSDRQFNYQDLAKKYFSKKEQNKNATNFDKSEVLNEWSAIEAAIKWDKGKLAKDMRNWKYEKSKSYLFNLSKKLKLKLKQFYFLDWTISIALRNQENHHFPEIICTNLYKS